MQISLVVMALFASFGAAHAGYPGFLCSASDLNNQTFFPCDADCFYQHGAEHGICGPRARGDYNCYCGRPAKTRIEQSLHCIEPLGKYSQLCVVDCQCNHGAQTGVCDWNRKYCKCIGRDAENKHCQFPTVKEFAQFTAGIVPSDSPAWGYLKYFVQRPAKCEVAVAVTPGPEGTPANKTKVVRSATPSETPQPEVEEIAEDSFLSNTLSSEEIGTGFSRDV